MQIKPKQLLLTLIPLIIAFVFLSFYIVQNPIPKFDLSISLWVQKFHTDWLDKLMLGISIFGELPFSLISVLLVAFIFFRYKYKLEAYFITTILSSGLVILLVKNLVDRPRPTEFYVRLVEINRFKSFPSGHVMSYVLFFGFLILLMNQLVQIPSNVRKIVSGISCFLITTIALSRIYLGAHWFTDTLGGFLLGLICLLPLSTAYLKKKPRAANPAERGHLN